MIARSKRRTGFTLLEVMLASVIAVLLLAALYYSLDIILKRTETSRDNVASDDLARAVVNRLNDDLSQSLGPLPPQSGGGSSPTTPAPTTPASPATTPPTGTTPTTPAPATTTAPADPAAEPDATADGTAAATDIPFQAGVIGTDKQLTLFLSRIPTSITDPSATTDASMAQPADLRRVTYYMASDGRGLCRQERPWVTADGVRNSIDPDRSDEAGDVIAPEVVDVVFDYFDGSGWAGEWDGSLVASDGVAVTGPPRGIRITMTLEIPGANGATQKKVQHVFVVRAATGTYTPPTTSDATMPDTTEVPAP